MVQSPALNARHDRRAGRSRPGRRGLLIVTLVAGLLVNGCSSTVDSAGPDSEWNAGEAIARVTERLAAAGIGVYAEADDSRPTREPAEPVSPVRLLEWQVRNLALEVDRDAGVSGVDLDAAVPAEAVESVQVTTSEIIAGWAKYGESPAAEFARELLGDGIDQPEQAVFPQLVTLLFASDIATGGASLPPPTAASEPTEPSSDGGSAPASPAPPTSEANESGVDNRQMQEVDGGMQAAPALTKAPCSAVIGFVDTVIAAMFNAIGRLHNPPEITGGGIFGKIVNVIGKALVGAGNLVIDGLHFVLANGVPLAIAPVMAIVAKIAGIVGTIGQIASAVRPWVLVMTADPQHNRKAIGNEPPRAGSVTATVDLGGLDEWPPFVADCAQVAGVTLPPLKPAGNPVTWTVAQSAPALVTEGGKDTALTANGAATLQYQTAVEPKYKKATEVVGQLTATAAVQRDDVTKLQDAFVKLVQEGLADLPAGQIISPLIYPYIQPAIASAFNALKHLRDVTNTIGVPITFHNPDEGEPTGTGTDECAGTTAGTPAVAPGHYQGAVESRVQVGTADIPIERVVTGPVDLVVTPGGKLSGTFELTAIMLEAGAEVPIFTTVNGQISGTAASPTASGEWDFGGELRWPLTIDQMPALTGGCDLIHGVLTGTFHSGLDDPDAVAGAEGMTEYSAPWSFDAKLVG